MMPGKACVPGLVRMQNYTLLRIIQYASRCSPCRVSARTLIYGTSHTPVGSDHHQHLWNLEWLATTPGTYIDTAVMYAPRARGAR